MVDIHNNNNTMKAIQIIADYISQASHMQDR